VQELGERAEGLRRPGGVSRQLDTEIGDDGSAGHGKPECGFLHGSVAALALLVLVEPDDDRESDDADDQNLLEIHDAPFVSVKTRAWIIEQTGEFSGMEIV
jgi:hypothetical protein